VSVLNLLLPVEQLALVEGSEGRFGQDFQTTRIFENYKSCDKMHSLIPILPSFISVNFNFPTNFHSVLNAFI
jgi:hypothetical protein